MGKICAGFLIFIAFSFLIVDESWASQRISAKKCDEYEDRAKRCISKFLPFFGLDRRPARPKEFPHSALIGMEESKRGNIKKYEWFCTGTLISSDYVVTLANCAQISTDLFATHVRLGDFNYGINTDDADPVDIGISEIITHPNFTITDQYDNIGLIRLKKTVGFNAHVRPACLPQTNEIRNNEAFLAGWPFKFYNPPRPFRSKTDMELRKYIMRIIPEMECSRSYAKHINDSTISNEITETQMCAIFQKLNNTRIHLPREIDRFDGAALQTYRPDTSCMYTVYGVTYEKMPSNARELPMLFTRIYPYLSWIESTVWAESQ